MLQHIAVGCGLQRIRLKHLIRKALLAVGIH